MRLTSQMRRLSPREVEQLTQGHIVGERETDSLHLLRGAC